VSKQSKEPKPLSLSEQREENYRKIDETLMMGEAGLIGILASPAVMTLGYGIGRLFGWVD
jgi:hypothetical protein